MQMRPGCDGLTAGTLAAVGSGSRGAACARSHAYCTALRSVPTSTDIHRKLPSVTAVSRVALLLTWPENCTRDHTYIDMILSSETFDADDVIQHIA